MASFCRLAIMAGSRTLASRSRTLTRKSLDLKTNPTSFSSAPKSIPRTSRVISTLESVETMIPLHSAIASARLRSNISVDSSCWSWLSQGLATPL